MFNALNNEEINIRINELGAKLLAISSCKRGFVLGKER